MTSTDPGAASAAVAEISKTAGLADYVLSGPPAGGLNGSYFRFSDFYADGDSVTYVVTDTSYTEIRGGVYSANTLTRGTFVFSTTGAPISWPDTGQRIVRPIVQGIPLCSTAPTVGQVLAWDGIEWCPATIGSTTAPIPNFAICPTPPLNGQVLIWSAAENAYCPADFCALVAACMASPTCPPFIVYSNRLVIPAYTGPLYTIRRSSDNATTAFSPSGGDAPAAAITTFLGGSTGNVILWNDQSGNALDAVEDVPQVAFPESPIWLAAQANGHPVLQFGTYGIILGGGYGHEGGLIAHSITFPTASWTVFIVAKHDDYHAASTYPNVPEVVSFLGINAGASDPPGNNFEIRTNPQPYPVGPPTDQALSTDANDATFSNGNGFDAQATFDPTAGYVVYEFSWSNNPTNDLALDVAKYSGTDYPLIEDNSYGGDFSVSGDMGVGGRSGSSSPTNAWVGWIAEIQIYNCMLTSAERTAKRSDIATYYGIALS